MGTILLQGKASVSSPPHQSPSVTASPQGEAAGRGRAIALIPFVRNACPSPPSRGAGRYGRRSKVCRKKKSPPSPVSKNQRRWVQGGGNSSSLVFFPPFLTGEMEAAGRHPPGRCAPRPVKAWTTRRVRTHGGQAPGPTSQVPTCDGPTRTTCRYRPARANRKGKPPRGFPFVSSRVMLWLPFCASRCRRWRWG